jgi:hypothetical protein
LRNYDRVKLSQMPRMADFATWITACEKAILSEGQPIGTFLDTYLANREEAVALEVESSSVGGALRRFMASLEQSDWSGTAGELLDILNERENATTVKTKGWPGDARALSSRLKRLATSLRSLGLEIAWKRLHGQRLILLRRIESHNEESSSDAPATAVSNEQVYEEFDL